MLAELAEGNQLYEEQFGFTYIVCATGKSAEEMLAILKRRLANDRDSGAARSCRATTADHANSFGKVVGRMSAITTHVLDTVLGKPAAGIAVRLEKQDGGGWIEVSGGEPKERAQYSPCDWAALSAGTTDADGRCRDLAPDADRRSLSAHI